MDFPDYQPASQVLERLKRIDFVAVVGPTAVGKTTLMKASTMQDPSLTIVLTNTSRVVRPGEQDGVDLHFRSKEEMLARINRREYVQVAPSLLGEIYATAPEDYPKEGVAMLAVLAEALGKFRALPFKSFKAVFIIPPSWQEWQARLALHGFEPEQLAKRLAEAKRSLAYALSDQTMQFVVNEDVARATNDFITIATGQPLNIREQQDQARARMIVQEILTKL